MVAISTGAAILGASLLSGAMSMGSSALSSGLSLYKSAKLAEHQAALNYQYAEKSARNTPIWNRAGLESAGFNPMLAVQNSTSGANSSWASPQDSSVPDFSNSLAAGIANAQSFQRLENETKTADSTVKMNEANGRKLIADAISQEMKNPFIPQKEQAEINKMSAVTQKLLRETSYMDALEENMKEQIRLGEMGIDANIYGSNAISGAMRYGAKTQKDIADNHLPSGKSESFRNYMSGIGSGIGSALGLGFGGSALYNGIMRNFKHVGF